MFEIENMYVGCLIAKIESERIAGEMQRNGEEQETGLGYG
jgi:hypothetical protein